MIPQEDIAVVAPGRTVGFGVIVCPSDEAHFRGIEDIEARVLTSWYPVGLRSHGKGLATSLTGISVLPRPAFWSGLGVRRLDGALLLACYLG